MGAQRLYLPLIYGLNRRRKLQAQLVLFADAHHDGRPASLEPLIAAMQTAEDAWEIKELYLDYGKASFMQLMRHMTRFMRLYAQAGTVVLCDNFLPAAGCRKRAGTLVVQLWHACGALKRFGYDTADDIPKNYRGNVFQNTDVVTVSAPFCIPHFASAMRLPPENILPLGVCRTDRYFDPEWRRQARERFAARYPKAAGKKIAVWAPTFRESPGRPECIRPDVAAWQRALGEDWLLLVKMHPHMEGRQRAERARAHQAADLPAEDLLVSADVLIADYSSLIYEYLLFDKPLVLFVPDYEAYREKRGFYMDYGELPGVRAEREEEVPGALREAVRQGARPADREAFLKKYMGACDGQSTKRVLECIREHAKATADQA